MYDGFESAVCTAAVVLRILLQIKGADILPHYADTSNYTEDEQILWQKITASQGMVFRTAKGLPFTYTIKGNEIFFSRKEKSITRATVNKAYHRMKDETITGSKQLGVFGASYLLPVLREVLIRLYP